MTVALRDRLFADSGTAISGATVQALLVTGGGTDVGTSSVVAATTTTDINGVWKFTALADAGAGNWYDVKIVNGTQVRWRYGNIQSLLATVLLQASYTPTSGTLWDFTSAGVRLPVAATDAASPAAGQVLLRSDLKQVRLHDGTAWHTLADLDTVQTFTNKTWTDPAYAVFDRTSATHTLPAVGTSTGKTRLLKSYSASMTVTSTTPTCIIAPGTATVVNSFVLGVGDSVLMVCDGANWWAI